MCRNCDQRQRQTVKLWGHCSKHPFRFGSLFFEYLASRKPKQTLFNRLRLRCQDKRSRTKWVTTSDAISDGSLLSRLRSFSGLVGQLDQQFLSLSCRRKQLLRWGKRIYLNETCHHVFLYDPICTISIVLSFHSFPIWSLLPWSESTNEICGCHALDATNCIRLSTCNLEAVFFNWSDWQRVSTCAHSPEEPFLEPKGIRASSTSYGSYQKGSLCLLGRNLFFPRHTCTVYSASVNSSKEWMCGRKNILLSRLKAWHLCQRLLVVLVLVGSLVHIRNLKSESE